MSSVNACDIDTVTIVSDAVNNCICQRTIIIAKLVIAYLEFNGCITYCEDSDRYDSGYR